MKDRDFEVIHRGFVFKISLAHEGHHCFFLQEVGLDKRPFSCVAIERIVLFDLSCLNDIYSLNDKVVLVYWSAMLCHTKCI